MAKRSTHPTLFDECKRIELAYLWKRYAMWMPRRLRTALSWTCGGRPAGNIDLVIDTREMYVELDYRYGDEPRHYRVPLVSVPSNLGKGRVWYFLCPQTGRRCRILYGVNGWFFHRTAFRGCCYDRQTFSKQARLLDYTVFPRQEELDDRLEKCRKTYGGKPTRRYKSLIRKQEKYEKVQRAIRGSLAHFFEK